MIQALLGGILIGLAASLMHFGVERIAGVSNLLHEAAFAGRKAVGGAFLAGLVVAGVLLGQVSGRAAPAAASLPTLAVAGLLVGFGARLGNGCTSGHGVCGVSRFSTRSIVATATFLATGLLTVLLVRHLVPLLRGGS